MALNKKSKHIKWDYNILRQIQSELPTKFPELSPRRKFISIKTIQRIIRGEEARNENQSKT